MSKDNGKRSWAVPADFEGDRLDRLLVHELPEWSRSKLQRLIRDGHVCIGGEAISKPGFKLERGQRVEVCFPEREVRLDPNVLQELEVLHECEHMLVINKQAGLLVHRSDVSTEASLSDLANARFGPLPSPQGEDRPGIVHRLDRETSGLIVLARSEVAVEELLRQFREREVRKTYLALVHGSPRFDSDWIEAPLGRSRRQPDRQSVLDEGEGRSASTFYETLEKFKGFALVHCQPKTGRTHQIRVHMSSVDLPIYADPLYRTQGAIRVPMPEAAPKLARHALHALRLEFNHPVSGERLKFEAPVPADLEYLIDWLRLHMPH